MFDGLTTALGKVFAKLTRAGKLTEANIQEGLREVRVALLEADVHYVVVKDLVKRVTARAVGAEVITSVSPAQQIVKAVHDELVAMLVAADVRRPAAIAQLQTLGGKLGIPVYAEPGGDPPAICANGVAAAAKDGRDLVILDTGGRLHVDDALMRELEAIKARTTPDRTYFVADAMTGQDAVTSAKAFHERLTLAGVLLTKMDGDARGGAALSIRAVTGAPVTWVGTGEATEALEEFHPERVASRILGMGDVVSLVEKAQAVMDTAKVEAMQQRMMEQGLDFEVYLGMLEQTQRMGPLKQVLGMIPGLGQLTGGQALDIPEDALVKPKAMIQSMTPAERQHPDLIDASRRRRIALGSGTTLADVNQLLKGFKMMRAQWKQVMDGGGLTGKLAGFQMKRLRKKFGG